MITLSEYLGFIFIEITNARVMADQESARIAEVYSKNPLLEKFSVPRFKIPEMELSIPVVISGAKFSTTFAFQENAENFESYVLNEIKISMKKLQIKKGKLNLDLSHIKDSVFKPINLNQVKIKTAVSNKKDGSIGVQDEVMDEDIAEFYDSLIHNPSPERTDEIVTINYAVIFKSRFEEAELMKDYNEFFPKNELFLESLSNVNSHVKSKTIVLKNKIDNLLVSPETSIVKAEASDLSVFNIKARITEEGIFVKTVRDKDSNKVISANVDFE